MIDGDCFRNFNLNILFNLYNFLIELFICKKNCHVIAVLFQFVNLIYMSLFGSQKNMQKSIFHNSLFPSGSSQWFPLFLEGVKLKIKIPQLQHLNVICCVYFFIIVCFHFRLSDPHFSGGCKWLTFQQEMAKWGKGSFRVSVRPVMGSEHI